MTQEIPETPTYSCPSTFLTASGELLACESSHRNPADKWHINGDKAWRKGINARGPQPAPQPKKQTMIATVKQPPSDRWSDRKDFE